MAAKFTESKIATIREFCRSHGADRSIQWCADQLGVDWESVVKHTADQPDISFTLNNKTPQLYRGLKLYSPEVLK